GANKATVNRLNVERDYLNAEAEAIRKDQAALNNSVDNIYCNKICNNTSYNLYYSVTGGNVNIPNNYWCTSDFAQISSGIYDGYDNINLGLVNYQPIDTMQCYLTTSIEGNEVQPFNLIILPNPAFNYLIIVAPYRAFDAILKIYNLLGKLEYSSRIIGQKSYIDISTLSSGIHILEIADGNNGSRQKFIKLQNIR
ncbi:MAG: T9SS type A sorting domain-containing protein, partial [Bacteroidia bacterium]